MFPTSGLLPWNDNTSMAATSTGKLYAGGKPPSGEPRCPIWSSKWSVSCKSSQWLSLQDSWEGCVTRALADDRCTKPLVVSYQDDSPKNCFCSNTTTCEEIPSTWLHLIIERNASNK